MKKLITILLIFAASTANAAPRLFFSDLISGPRTGLTDGTVTNQGAIITIWGTDLGSTQGESTITACGASPANVYYWGDADGTSGPADLNHFGRDMQEISFALSSSANDGAGTISVTVGGETSNTLAFTVRSGSIYFARSGGNNSTGDGSWANAYLTIGGAVSNEAAAGVIIYAQTTTDTTTIAANVTGTSANQIAVVAYPNSVAAIDMSSAVRDSVTNWISGDNPNAEYWVFSKLDMEGDHTTPGLINFGPHTYNVGEIIDGMRIIGCNMTTPFAVGSSGSLTANGWDSAFILGNEVHHCGNPSGETKLQHCMYVNNHSGAVVSDNTISYNVLRDGGANRGLQFFSDGDGHADSEDFIVTDNIIYNQVGNGINFASHLTGTWYVSNNIIYNCGTGPHPGGDTTSYAGIYLTSYLDGNPDYQNDATYYIEGNTIAYNGNDNSFSTGSGQVDMTTAFDGTAYFHNNIFVSDGTVYQPYFVSGGQSPASGAHNNLWYGDGNGPSWDTGAVNADPVFTSSTDYTLQSTSNARDAGIDISSRVPYDLNGVSRPQEDDCAIGAFEYDTGASPPNNDGAAVDISDSSAPAAVWSGATIELR